VEVKGNTGSTGTWGVRDGTTTVAEGVIHPSADGFGRYVSVAFIVTLTAGASKQLKWGYHSEGTYSAQIKANSATPSPPAVMEVWSA
jgi:hypothetical protein